jgi:hypothetical protein
MQAPLRQIHALIELESENNGCLGGYKMTLTILRGASSPHHHPKRNPKWTDFGNDLDEGKKERRKSE